MRATAATGHRSALNRCSVIVLNVELRDVRGAVMRRDREMLALVGPTAEKCSARIRS